MKQTLKLAVISVALIVNFGAAYAQNMPTPKKRKMRRETPFRRQPLGKKIHQLPPKTETGTRMPIRRAA
jgi:hypothetical protein